MKAFKSLLGALILMVSGCSRINMADYSDFTNIDTEGIPVGRIYDFCPLERDSTLDISIEYDVIIAVRYTNGYASRSVIFNIEEFSLQHESPDSTSIELQLIDEDGRPLGKNRYGINEVVDTIRKAYRLPEGYSLSLSSPLSQEATAGIKAIGLILSAPHREVLPIFR